MKKLVSVIALMAVLVIASSAESDKEMFLTEGDRVPELSLVNASGAITLDDMEGEYVLLTFWSSLDAQSRVDCNAYSSWIAKHPSNKLRHVAVNLDAEQVLFEEIVRLDNLDNKAQYNLQGKEAQQAVSDFNLQQGFGSILIDCHGRVAMFNPSTEMLSSII